MALPDSLVLQVGTQILFADHAADFNPTAANDLEVGTPTDVQFDLTGVANAAARQSAKVDLGESRAPLYSVIAALEFAATPAAGSYVQFFWNPSPISTAANGNCGGASGSDAAYTGIDSDLANSVRHLQFIGQMTTTNDPTPVVQVSRVGVFSPQERYGSLIIVDNSGAATHADAVESHVVFNPINAVQID